ncbi:TOBE domain-containing protein [Candidatus Nitrospira bockiana]
MATVVTRANPQISARNQVRGQITHIEHGQAMSVVTVEGGGHRLTAAITRQAASDLALQPNQPVTAIVKSTELAVLKGDPGDVKLSTRNQIAGRVTSVQKGAAMAVVNIDAGPFQLTASITKQAAEDLHLNAEDRVVALVKATDVVLQKG